MSSNNNLPIRSPEKMNHSLQSYYQGRLPGLQTKKLYFLQHLTGFVIKPNILLKSLKAGNKIYQKEF
jgi:hypothetical protein